MYRIRIAVLVVATALTAVLAAALAVARPGIASAHPLGNFTINHYDRIEVSENGIEVYSVVDMAEIPAFRERQQIDANGDGAVDSAEGEAYAAAKVDGLRRNLRLRVDGDEAALTDVSHEIAFPEGQGGLSLLRLTGIYRAELPSDWRTRPPRVEFEDTNDADRLGWREIVVRNGAGTALLESSAPTDDISRELTAYPADALSSPLDVRSATFSFEPGIGLAAPAVPDDAARATRSNPDSTLSHFSDLIAKDHLTPGVVVVALLAAMGFGAIHALSPGHGKTVVAAYLVGSRGTARHALLLGLTVTATHTSTVYAMGFVALYLSEYIVPERLYPLLGVGSGALIVVMGLSLVVARLRASGLASQAWRAFAVRLPRRTAAAPALAVASAETGALMMGAPSRVSASSDAGALARTDRPRNEAHHRDHGEPHRHGLGPAHRHDMAAAGEKLSVRQLVGLGIFGGILPCPSAIVVMLSAIALHRVGFGLVLIVAFSLGLAGVLTAIGFAMVYAPLIGRKLPLVARVAEHAGRSERASALAVRLFPIAAAVAVTAAGAVILLRATSQL